MSATLRNSVESAHSRGETRAKPLCVDLDGTLIQTDLLFESLLLLARQNFFYLFCIPFWLLAGKASLKHRLAQKIKFDPKEIHYNEEVLVWVKEQRQLGRHIVLATASNRKLAEGIAVHLDVF